MPHTPGGITPMPVVSTVGRLSSVMETYFNNPSRDCAILTDRDRTPHSLVWCDVHQTYDSPKQSTIAVAVDRATRLHTTGYWSGRTMSQPNTTGCWSGRTPSQTQWTHPLMTEYHPRSDTFHIPNPTPHHGPQRGC